MEETAPGIVWRMRYTGRFFDIVAQLQDNLRRKYDAAIARWASTDPIGFEAGDANLYRYVNNGPLWQVDPLGMFCICNKENENKDIPPELDMSRWSYGEHCKHCVTCEETDWGDKFDQNELVKYKNHLLKAIQNKYLGQFDFKKQLKIIFGDCSGAFNLTCVNLRKFPKANHSSQNEEKEYSIVPVIGICVRNDISTCDALAMLAHEVTHLEQNLEQFDRWDWNIHKIKKWLKEGFSEGHRKRREGEAYQKSCELYAKMDCLDPEKGKFERYVKRCRMEGVKMSTGGNVPTIRNACTSFMDSISW